MPVVHIEMFEGRTIEQKKNLVKKVTTALVETINCPEEAVIIIIKELPKTNWATGGKLASE